MKRLTAFATAFLVLAIGVSTGHAEVWYFDQNGGTLGSGVAAQGYNWTTDGSGPGPGFWNPNNADGTFTNLPGATTSSWVNGNDAVFSAGTDAIGVEVGLNLGTGAAAPTANSMLVEEGHVHVLTNLVTVTNNITVGTPTSTALLEVTGGSSAAAFNGAGKLIIENGSTFWQSNPGSAGTFLATGRTIEINGTAFLQYNDKDGVLDNKVSIYAGTITGVGGTTLNGGAGTLYVNGGDQLGVANNANMTFAKLVVDTGSYRLRNAGTASDNTFGATPLTVLTDQITLKNGGAIGVAASVTFSANRGITIESTGGRFSGIGLGTITVPGPVTANGGELKIDGRNLTTTSTTFGNSGGGTTFSHANNLSTFTNMDMVVNSSTITFNSSVNMASLTGGSETATGGTVVSTATATGTVTIGTGATLTVGSNNASTSYAGRVTGAGSFTKVGTGELLMNTTPATSTPVATGIPATVYSGEWTNTGGINIDNGSIKFGTPTSGFASAVTVTIGATGKLNMNGINDNFGALAGSAGAIVDMIDLAATPGNLTLAAASPVSTTYSGTIVGGGNLTKSSSSTQKFAGNATLGTVALNGGLTSVLSPATLTSVGGVTVAAAGGLGGTGTIAGAITNNGTLAPGDGGVGTLSVTGNVTNGAASAWHIELSGAAADKLAVTGNIDLLAADSLNVTGTGTGTSWLIGSYTGTVSGVFDTITSGYTVSYTGGNITLNAAPACAAGDANCDGNFNAEDYVLIRKVHGDVTTGTGLTQYTAWRAAFTGIPGSGSGLGGGAVPEPTSIGLVLIGLTALGCGRRGRAA